MTRQPGPDPLAESVACYYGVPLFKLPAGRHIGLGTQGFTSLSLGADYSKILYALRMPSEEIQLLLTAADVLKDIGGMVLRSLPHMLTSFFSAVLGGGVAYYALHYQEGIRFEREKLDTCNKWSIRVEGVFQSLVAFKGNYVGQLTDDPIQRALKVRTLISHGKSLDLNYAELSFIAPSKETAGDQNAKWRQLSRIRALIENYNFLLQAWEKRNRVERPIKEALLAASGPGAAATLSRERIIEVIGESNLASLVDLTEKAVHLTDDLIIESDDFLRKFPAIAESAVNTKKVSRYGTVVHFDMSGNEHLQEMISRAPEVDHQELANVLGLPESEVLELYNHGYN